MASNETIKIYQNQYVDFLRFLFRVDSLKFKKDLEVVYNMGVLKHFVPLGHILVWGY